jgi:hypothetical protein
MTRFLMALAAAAVIGGMGMSDRAVAADGYFYAAPSYYVAPPAYVYPPVYFAPTPVVVQAPPVYAPPPAYYYPPAVAYYPPAVYARSIYARPGKIKVKEYTPWGKRKYEWEYSRHGYWKLDD